MPKNEAAPQARRAPVAQQARLEKDKELPAHGRFHASFPVIQRTKEDAEKYAPQSKHSVTNWFGTHHCSDVVSFKEAEKLHESRPDAQFNTIADMTRADASREIYRYLEDSPSVGDQQEIDFITRGQYKYCTTGMDDAGHVRLVSQGRLRLKLTMSWNDNGYYEIIHLEGTS
jgi:hypothetical protein